MKRKSVALSAALLSTLVIIGWLFLNNLSQIPPEGFGIFSLENNELLISDVDIVSYNKSSHEIKLTDEGVEKIKALQVPVRGKPFVVMLNGREMYNGSFWTPISSISYSGIVIETLVHNNTIKIEMGYPTSKFFENKDPRDQSEIFGHFQKVGKLVQ